MTAPEDVQPFAEKIYGETHRLIALVEDIISLSRLDEGGKELAFSSVKLYDIVSGVADNLSGLAAQSGIRLTASGDDTVVTGVPELIRGIVYNLCDNAIKYNRPGGQVEVTVRGNSLIVKDTGIGIPQEHLGRIFERFYRVDKSRSKAVGGTGLGLSIVKHAALIHKAETKVESTVGEGTTVTVTFPKEDL